MRWSDLDVEALARAVEIFLLVAYGEQASQGDKVRGLRACPSLEAALRHFSDESREELGKTMRRWTLRLGNRNYPYMKLVLEEYLIQGEFFFVVDTHDKLEIQPGYPDYEAWQELQRFNRGLKEEIECRWHEAKLPTLEDLKCLVEALDVPRAAGDGRGVILLAEDEPAIAESVGSYLDRWGYRVVCVPDGAEAVRRAREIRPDLILMDYQMPHMDGMTACARLKEAEETRHIPVLVATACSVDLRRIGAADGFLVKPYERDTLLRFIQHHLERGGESRGRTGG